jgi:hypothetical protein
MLPVFALVEEHLREGDLAVVVLHAVVRRGERAKRGGNASVRTQLAVHAAQEAMVLMDSLHALHATCKRVWMCLCEQVRAGRSASEVQELATQCVVAVDHTCTMASVSVLLARWSIRLAAGGPPYGVNALLGAADDLVAQVEPTSPTSPQSPAPVRPGDDVGVHGERWTWPFRTVTLDDVLLHPTAVSAILHGAHLQRPDDEACTDGAHGMWELGRFGHRGRVFSHVTCEARDMQTRSGVQRMETRRMSLRAPFWRGLQCLRMAWQRGCGKKLLGRSGARARGASGWSSTLWLLWVERPQRRRWLGSLRIVRLAVDSAR